MQGVFWDIIRTETYTNHLVTADYKKNRIEDEARLQKQVFMIHGVSKEEFYKSYNYYKKYPLLMKTLLDSMINKAGREKNFNPGGTPELVK